MRIRVTRRDAADVAFCLIYGAAKAEAPRVRTTQAVSTQAA